MFEPYCSRCGSTHDAGAHCGRDRSAFTVVGDASFPGTEPLPGGGILVRPMYGPWPADSYWTPFDAEGTIRDDLDGWHFIGYLRDVD